MYIQKVAGCVCIRRQTYVMMQSSQNTWLHGSISGSRFFRKLKLIIDSLWCVCVCVFLFGLYAACMCGIAFRSTHMHCIKYQK